MEKIKTFILTAHSASELNKRINEHIEQGYKVVGAHQVVVVHSQNRFAGTQHRDTIHTLEYSVTLQSA